ncbi:unnamed protein product [Hymenolepis diminuta]|uniref:RT_RNaseH domain-containing protein n=1 Tax=Hymenolepis diminuta TaxID=6216 RepID=A0A0R3SXP6_HYMDI|nr:unnamed protein product [Hymenolepis diminuta]
MLTSNMSPSRYNPILPIIVAVDAPNHDLGAVISHVFSDDSEKTVVEMFHKLFCGRPLALLTDHKPLLPIFGSKKSIPVYTANRLLRWSAILLGYDFDIKYRNRTEQQNSGKLIVFLASSTTRNVLMRKPSLQV